MSVFKKRVEAYMHPGVMEVSYAEERDTHPKMKCLYCHRRPCICDVKKGEIMVWK